MGEKIIECGNGFWNIRGSFKIGGLIDVGTQVSLVRLGDGRFVFLDSYSLSPDTLAQIDEITGGRDNVAAVINLHPFHTLHTEAMHAAFPNARHFGTPRHVAKFPDLAWESETTDHPQMWEAFAPDLAFSKPDGVELIPSNENLHCGSILAYHPASRSIHVDDTFNYRPSKKKGQPGKLGLHPTLKMTLEKRAGAAAEFRDWGARLARDWGTAERICAAHSGVLTAKKLGTDTVQNAMVEALARAEKKLIKHEKKFS